MQNTRLNTLVDAIAGQFDRWLRNPWRKLSVITISLLLGNFIGTIISTTAGARADWDAVTAAILVIVTEALSRLAYGSKRDVGRSVLVEMTNALKIGLTFSLFVDAMKLGS
jgi:hypothetical protein